MKQIRKSEHSKSIKIILLNSVRENDLKEHSHGSEIDNYLQKPIRQFALVRTLIQILGDHELHATAHISQIKTVTTFSRLHILLAEDNVVNQKVAVNILKKLNLTVTLAKDGQEAVALATTNKFDLILMDIQMPNMEFPVLRDCAGLS